MDNSSVIVVPISRNDRFYFTRKYDREKIMPLLAEANVLNRIIKDIPILPDLATQLEEDIIRRSIFGTAAIEGNPLTEEEVGRILSGKEKTGVTKERAEREIENLKEAYSFVKKECPIDPCISPSEKLIRSVHKLIVLGIDPEHDKPGEYRHGKVKVGDAEHGGTYLPPISTKDIVLLMKTFYEWMNGEEMKKEDPIVRAVVEHYHLGMIHPFSDGNGRTARLLEALLLQWSGVKYAPVMLSNYYYRNIHDYYRAFSLARKHPEKELTPFLEFVLKGLIESFEEIRKGISYFIRKFSLRDYYAFLSKERRITQRQHDLLAMLLEKPFNNFTSSDFLSTTPFNVLYRGRSERTILRDVKKLVGQNLLNSVGDGIYKLNFRVI